jgi:hypothetical protein
LPVELVGVRGDAVEIDHNVVIVVCDDWWRKQDL